MVLLINSYSFVILGLVSVLIVGSLVWRVVGLAWAVVTVTATVAALVVFQVTATTEADTFATLEDFDDALTSGRPVLLELYSNY